MQTCKPFGRLLAHSLPGNQSLGFLKETCSREGGDAAQPTVRGAGRKRQSVVVCLSVHWAVPAAGGRGSEGSPVHPAICPLPGASWECSPRLCDWGGGGVLSHKPEATQALWSLKGLLKLCDLRGVINLSVF